MSLLVVGSIAFDSVATPAGSVVDALGGSATYFSYAAGFFTDVRLVGVVGDDFPSDRLDILADHGIDTSGVSVVAGKTFRWAGKYEGDLSEAETLDVQLNVFGDFDATVPDAFRDSPHVFLANGSPKVQARILEQMNGTRLAVADTMNHWINDERDALIQLLGRVDGLVLNDREAVQLTGEANLIRAGRAIQALGPKLLVIKKGPHGAVLFSPDGLFVLPAYPTENVVDTTGAGDSFAGGMFGYLASRGSTALADLKQAMVYGTVVASFTVEGFSLDRLREIGRDDIEARARELTSLVQL